MRRWSCCNLTWPLPGRNPFLPTATPPPWWLHWVVLGSPWMGHPGSLLQGGARGLRLLKAILLPGQSVEAPMATCFPLHCLCTHRVSNPSIGLQGFI